MLLCNEPLTRTSPFITPRGDLSTFDLASVFQLIMGCPLLVSTKLGLSIGLTPCGCDFQPQYLCKVLDSEVDIAPRARLLYFTFLFAIVTLKLTGLDLVPHKTDFV
jgi:hypothetical protein